MATRKELPLRDRSGQAVKIWSKKDTDSNLLNLIGYEGTVSILSFSGRKEAKEYAMERRLLLLRKFETLIEPYFGTENAVECSGNLRTDLLKIEDHQLYVGLQLLSQGAERLIHDCLMENNSHWVNIEFLVCGNKFYDIRTYAPIKEKRPAYHQNFFCR